MTAIKLNGKAVALIGAADDLSYLSEHFCFTDFGVYRVTSTRRNSITNEEEEYDDYYLKSSSFDSKKDDWEIYSDAIDLLELINGQAQLETRLMHTMNGKAHGGPELEIVLASRAVDEFKEGKKIKTGVLGSTANAYLMPSDFRKMLESQKLEVPEDIKQRDDTSSIEAISKQDKVIETRFPLLELTKKDPNVREALAYFGYQHSWASLYRAWDVIKKEVGYHKKHFDKRDFRALIDGSLIRGNEERFKRTANYYRHGGPGREDQLPSNPMKLDEAVRFMRILMLYWVNWKYNKSG